MNGCNKYCLIHFPLLQLYVRRFILCHFEFIAEVSGLSFIFREKPVVLQKRTGSEHLLSPVLGLR